MGKEKEREKNIVVSEIVWCLKVNIYMKKNGKGKEYYYFNGYIIFEINYLNSRILSTI